MPNTRPIGAPGQIPSSPGKNPAPAGSPPGTGNPNIPRGGGSTTPAPIGANNPRPTTTTVGGATSGGLLGTGIGVLGAGLLAAQAGQKLGTLGGQAWVNAERLLGGMSPAALANIWRQQLQKENSRPTPNKPAGAVPTLPPPGPSPQHAEPWSPPPPGESADPSNPSKSRGMSGGGQQVGRAYRVTWERYYTRCDGTVQFDQNLAGIVRYGPISYFEDYNRNVTDCPGNPPGRARYTGGGNINAFNSSGAPVTNSLSQTVFTGAVDWNIAVFVRTEDNLPDGGGPSPPFKPVPDKPTKPAPDSNTDLPGGKPGKSLPELAKAGAADNQTQTLILVTQVTTTAATTQAALGEQTETLTEVITETTEEQAQKTILEIQKALAQETLLLKQFITTELDQTETAIETAIDIVNGNVNIVKTLVEAGTQSIIDLINLKLACNICELVADLESCDLTEVLQKLAELKEQLDDVEEEVKIVVGAVTLEASETLYLKDCSNIESETGGVPKQVSGYILPRIYKLGKVIYDQMLLGLQNQCSLPTEFVNDTLLDFHAVVRVRPPVLIIHFYLDDNVAGGSHAKPAKYTLRIPHYNGSGPPTTSPVGPYSKGSYMAIARLDDNSAIYINAATEAEARRVLDEALRAVKSSVKTNLIVKPAVRSDNLKQGRVIPKYARYYAKGSLSDAPEWEARFD